VIVVGEDVDVDVLDEDKVAEILSETDLKYYASMLVDISTNARAPTSSQAKEILEREPMSIFDWVSCSAHAFLNEPTQL